MNAYWKVETHGDPIGTIQGFVQRVWEQQDLDGMLVSANGESGPRLIEDPAKIKDINPFKPLMSENLSRHVAGSLAQNPEKSLGALLRPCEMRALVEISRRRPILKRRLTTLCIDCLGTFSHEEYAWRASRKGSHERLAEDALKFARQGGILAYRYRAACQMCISPSARDADLNLHVLGLPVRRYLLIEAADEAIAARLDLERLSDGPADADQVQQHESILAKQADFHLQTTGRIIEALGNLLPESVEALVDQFENCGGCERCMSVCPICSAEYPKRGADGRHLPESIHHWLISCAGCGMCEQACESNLPLSVIFRSIKEKIFEELDQIAGQERIRPLSI